MKIIEKAIYRINTDRGWFINQTLVENSLENINFQTMLQNFHRNVEGQENFTTRELLKEL